MMNISLNQQGQQRSPSNTSSNQKKTTITAKLKSFFSLETKQDRKESEIDYYHQYVFPTKVNRIIKKQRKLKQ